MNVTTAKIMMLIFILEQQKHAMIKITTAMKTIDEGFPTPGITTGLVFLNDKQTLNWNTEAIADRYDVMKGDLMTIRLSLGDFTASLTHCLEDNSSDTESSDTGDPGPGGGFYYLVRAQASCKDGTCNCGHSSQVEDRDAEIETSENKCP